MSSSAARQIAKEELECLTDEQKQMLADQVLIDPEEPFDRELAVVLAESDAQFERGEYVDAEVVLRELRARSAARR